MRKALPTDLLWLLMEATDSQLAWVKQELQRKNGGNRAEPPGEPANAYRIREESTRRRAGKYDRTRISTWRIWFDGEEILMPMILATEYLVFLIRHQGKTFSAAQLTECIRKSAVAETMPGQHQEILYGGESEAADLRGRIGEPVVADVILEGNQIQELTQHLTEMLAEKKAHEQAGDYSSANYLKLKDDIERLQQILQRNTKQLQGKFFPKEYQKGTTQKQADTIRKLIRQLLDKHLKSEYRALFDHLNDRRCLMYGMKNGYSPTPAIPWKIERRKK